MCLTTVTLPIFLVFTWCESKSYKNHTLFRVLPYDFDTLTFLKKLDVLYNATYWKKPTMVPNAVEFSISPLDSANLHRDTLYRPFLLTPVIKDLESAFERQTKQARPYMQGHIKSYNWHTYYRLNDIYYWMRDLSNLHPEEVSVRSIGKTYENRSILSLKLTLKGSTGRVISTLLRAMTQICPISVYYKELEYLTNVCRSKVIIEGGSHANEWLSPVYVTYMIYTLLNAKNYNNYNLDRLSLMYTWIFVPVLNPDGYEYAHTNDRLWRKNRRDGHGVDINRNYGIAFGEFCADNKKESREYCGDGSFSEQESTSMSMFAKENSVHLDYYLAVHSYGQHIILPYSYTDEYEDNYLFMKTKAEGVAERMYERHYLNFTVGNNFEVKGYLESGTSTDWVKKALKIPHVATIQLPDTGTFGYALPPQHILHVCRATMDGLMIFFDRELDKYIIRAINGVTQEIKIRPAIVLLCYVVLCFL